MKLHILRKNNELVDGFTPVFVEDGLDMSNVSDNECEFILAPDIMDSYPSTSSEGLLHALAKKLRMSGTLVVGGTHIRLLAKAILNGLVSHEEGSSMIGRLQSATTPETVSNIVKVLGLRIDSVTIDGVHYEIKATRSQQNGA